MHRNAEQRRRWRLWENKEKYGDDQAAEQKRENYYRASLDIRFLLERGKNNVQAKRKIGVIGFCHFCGSEGVIVEKFPRRGYGKCPAGF